MNARLAFMLKEWAQGTFENRAPLTEFSIRLNLNNS